MTVEGEKIRKPRSDKGVPRGSRTTPQGDAPIHVCIRLKGRDEEIIFGCARRTVENGFHVFFYPSELDRYRQTRREFAISEIVDIAITEAAPAYDLRQSPALQPENMVFTGTPGPTITLPYAPTPGPKIHSVRQNLRKIRGSSNVIERLETSNGPVKLSEEDLGNALGVGAEVNGVGDHSA